MRRHAFTLIELLLVLAIIGILAGLLLPAVSVLRERSRRQTTTALCRSLTVAIRMYGGQPLQNAGSLSYRSWDWNQDGIIDGRPADDGDFTAVLRTDAARAGYVGLVGQLHPDLPKSALEAASGRIIDPWKRPLRIAWALRAYDGEDVGVSSLGRDGVQSDDDLTSWGKR
jgi:prepilin-type N-terminal cleavage/methylation domain-containing protein